jgi:RNA polymerase sigma factor (sigma-70 family)
MVDAGHAMRSNAAVARHREPLPAALLRLASDQRLVEQVRAGSERAFEALFDRHHRSVLAFCRHMLRSPEEAEDAVQHTFMAAYRDLMRSEQPVVLRPWLYGIARHRCLNVLRDRRRHAGDGAPAPATGHLGAEVVAREDLRAVLADMAGLPDDQRAALILAELGDVSHEEIAQVLGCRREKVKALVFQARASLIAGRESRETPCADIREELSTLRGGALRRTTLRRHLRECPGCRAFREEVRVQRRALGLLLPVTPMVGLQRSVLGALFGSGGGAGGAAVTVAALSTGGLAATALAMLALPGGGMIALTRAEPAAPAPAPRMAPARAGPAPAHGTPADAARASSATTSVTDTHRTSPARDSHRGQPERTPSGAVGHSAVTAPASARSPELPKASDEANPIGPERADGRAEPATPPKRSDRAKPANPPRASDHAKPANPPRASNHRKPANPPKASDQANATKPSQRIEPAGPIGLAKTGPPPAADGRGEPTEPAGHAQPGPAETPAVSAPTVTPLRAAARGAGGDAQGQGMTD